ncbi:hypothetical protein D3C76_427140 [compost metagenome]
MSVVNRYWFPHNESVTKKIATLNWGARLFDEMSKPVGHEWRRGGPYITELYITIALMLLSYINRWEADEQIGAHGLMKLEDHRSWGEVIGFLKETAQLLFSVRKSGEQKRAASAIGKICTYIEVH